MRVDEMRVENEGISQPDGARKRSTMSISISEGMSSIEPYTFSPRISFPTAPGLTGITRYPLACIAQTFIKSAHTSEVQKHSVEKEEN